MADLVGQQLGAYALQEVIGRGGMATIYRARAEASAQDVAIKVLLVELAGDRDFIHRFRREAQVVSQMEHPHILRVLDFGEQDRFVYIVMPHITGGDLYGEMHEGPLALNRAARVLSQVASALTYAHTQGVVHRDLKPENILLDEQRNTFLTDFGIAKMLAGTSHITATGMLMGTPSYMAPEQWRTEAVDGRTDVYSLGMLLYEMLVGIQPFEADSPFALMYEHIDKMPTSPLRYHPGLPPGIEPVIYKAIAKAPAQRYASPTALAEAFAEVVARAPNPDQRLPRPKKRFPPQQEGLQTDLDKSTLELPVVPRDKLPSWARKLEGAPKVDRAATPPSSPTPSQAVPAPQSIAPPPAAPPVAPPLSAAPPPSRQQSLASTGFHPAASAPQADSRRSPALMRVLGGIAMLMFMAVIVIAGLLVLNDSGDNGAELPSAAQRTGTALVARQMTAETPVETPAASGTATSLPTATSEAADETAPLGETPATVTPLPTNTPKATATDTPLASSTPALTATLTAAATSTPDAVILVSPPPIATNTLTPLPTNTPKPTATPDAEGTLSALLTQTAASVDTATVTPPPTNTPQPTDTPVPTDTPAPTATANRQATLDAMVDERLTATAVSAMQAIPTATEKPSATVEPTATPKPRATLPPPPSATPTLTAVATLELLPTATKKSTLTPVPPATVTRVATSTPPPTPTPAATSTPPPTATPQRCLAQTTGGSAVNLRAGPGIGFAVVDRLLPGESLPVLLRTDTGFAYLYAGWVDDQIVALNPTEACARVPVIAARNSAPAAVCTVRAAVDFADLRVDPDPLADRAYLAERGTRLTVFRVVTGADGLAWYYAATEDAEWRFGWVPAGHAAPITDCPTPEGADPTVVITSGATPVPTSGTGAVTVTCVVETTTTTALNVRLGPGIGFAVADQLQPRTQYPVWLRTNTGWAYVGTGWVDDDFVRFAPENCAPLISNATMTAAEVCTIVADNPLSDMRTQPDPGAGRLYLVANGVQLSVFRVMTGADGQVWYFGGTNDENFWFGWMPASQARTTSACPPPE